MTVRKFSARYEKNPLCQLKAPGSENFLPQPTSQSALQKENRLSRSVEFGSIFLFLNGFRVLPYGKEGDDWLGLDRRKQQGARRFLSTRDVVGHVKIDDREENFQPTLQQGRAS